MAFSSSSLEPAVSKNERDTTNHSVSCIASTGSSLVKGSTESDFRQGEWVAGVFRRSRICLCLLKPYRRTLARQQPLIQDQLIGDIFASTNGILTPRCDWMQEQEAE